MGKFLDKVLIKRIEPIIQKVIIICFDIQLDNKIDSYDDYEKKILEKLKNEINK